MSSDSTKIDGNEYYKPIIKEVENLAGLTMNVADKGENVDVLRKGFFHSFDPLQLG